MSISPIALYLDSGPRPRARSRSATRSKPLPAPRVKVLIVDDEDDIREVAQLSLEMMAGWQVIGVDSGERALVDAARERPDVVLLDVMMPGMDGPTTARRLRAQAETGDIPVILLTAKVRSSDEMQFAGLDVAGVISKPFDPISLADQITSILRGR